MKTIIILLMSSMLFFSCKKEDISSPSSDDNKTPSYNYNQALLSHFAYELPLNIKGSVASITQTNNYTTLLDSTYYEFNADGTIDFIKKSTGSIVSCYYDAAGKIIRYEDYHTLEFFYNSSGLLDSATMLWDSINGEVVNIDYSQANNNIVVANWHEYTEGVTSNDRFMWDSLIIVDNKASRVFNLGDWEYSDETQYTYNSQGDIIKEINISTNETVTTDTTTYSYSYDSQNNWTQRTSDAVTSTRQISYQ